MTHTHAQRFYTENAPFSIPCAVFRLIHCNCIYLTCFVRSGLMSLSVHMTMKFMLDFCRALSASLVSIFRRFLPSTTPRRAHTHVNFVAAVGSTPHKMHCATAADGRLTLTFSRQKPTWFVIVYCVSNGEKRNGRENSRNNSFRLFRRFFVALCNDTSKWRSYFRSVKIQTRQISWNKEWKRQIGAAFWLEFIIL